MSKLNALVTGANKGIGFEIAKGLAEAGYETLIGCRDTEAGSLAAKEIGNGAQAVRVDFEGPDTLQETLAELKKNHPQLDVLVNNAGTMDNGDVFEKPSEFIRVIQVNFLGAFQTIQAYLPQMNERNFGRIVNVSSGWGSFSEGLSGPVGYSTSKAALNALTVSVSRHTQSNVKINACCPGWVRTDMGGPEANLSPVEGADTPIWLATLADDGPNGGFFRKRKEIKW